MTASSDCEQSPSCLTPNNSINKSVQTPHPPQSPSTSGSVRQEQAQQQHGGGVETLPKTPLGEHDDVTTRQYSHIQEQKQGQKRECTSAIHQAQKRHKIDELGTSNLISSAIQSDVQEQDHLLNSTPSVNSPETTSNPIQYWTHDGTWPENFANMNQEQSDIPQKRGASSSYTQSYTRRYEEGEVPEPFSEEYEIDLSEHRMIMEEPAGRSRISKESKLFCDQLLEGTHEEPQHTMFSTSHLVSVWGLAQNCNKARIVRDITSLLVPSPALLSISGDAELRDLVEEIGVEWTRCNTLRGPKPQPDFAVGLARSAFTNEEITKLKNYTSLRQPTAFTDRLYFPFLLCEVKCREEVIRKADRQNMHSSSIAVRAIVKLDRTRGPERMNALDGETLVYSISHDHEFAKLYGHFVHKGTFYHYLIASFILNCGGNPRLEENPRLRPRDLSLGLPYPSQKNSASPGRYG